jgi:hypothetical protein
LARQSASFKVPCVKAKNEKTVDKNGYTATEREKAKKGVLFKAYLRSTSFLYRFKLLICI